MHELIDILFPRSNYADCYRETQSKKAREWLEEKAEIFGGNARNVLGIAEKTLEEKFMDEVRSLIDAVKLIEQKVVEYNIPRNVVASDIVTAKSFSERLVQIADQHFNK